MKKTMIWLLVVASIIFSLQMSVLAHSGRTDGSGGHYNHSTGKYHYHHGYSAHDHYDMDGDGDKDCPYKFNAETDYDISDKDNGDTGNNHGKQNSNDEAYDDTNDINATKGKPWYSYIGIVIVGAMLLIPIACVLFSVFFTLWKLVEWSIDKIKNRKGR